MTDFEQALDRIARREFRGCKQLLAAERLSGGASQETYRLKLACDGGEEQLALRRAVGGTGKQSLDNCASLAVEAQLMTLAAAQGVPEPRVHYVLTPEDDLGEGFIMSWIEGEALGARIARHEQFAEIRPKLAWQCGEILARIHAIDVAATGLDQALETLEPETFIRRKWAQYRAFGSPQPMIDYTARWLLDNLPPTTRPCLVHNDFRNGNLMVDPADGVIAVLDWEVAHIGDPMRDLGWICTNSWRFGVTDKEVGGFGDLDDLLAGYAAGGGGEVDPRVVRYWEVFGSFWWAIGCLYMAEHYRTGPDRSVERPAIGRRSSECQIDCVNLIIPGAADLPAPAAEGDNNMPRVTELVASVASFLREEVRDALPGRNGFMARVAANSLDIVGRELSLGPAADAAELSRLKALLDDDGPLPELRQRLADRLNDETTALDDPALTAHLRATVLARVAIDQPGYSGFKTASGSATRSS